MKNLNENENFNENEKFLKNFRKNQIFTILHSRRFIAVSRESQDYILVVASEYLHVFLLVFGRGGPAVTVQDSPVVNEFLDASIVQFLESAL